MLREFEFSETLGILNVCIFKMFAFSKTMATLKLYFVLYYDMTQLESCEKMEYLENNSLKLPVDMCVMPFFNLMDKVGGPRSLGLVLSSD